MAGLVIARRPRVLIGRDARIVREVYAGLALEGRARLRPGQRVDVVLPRVDRPGLIVRRALVWSWEAAAVGSDGLIYRGFCRWD